MSGGAIQIHTVCAPVFRFHSLTQFVTAVLDKKDLFTAVIVGRPSVNVIQTR